MSLGVPSLGAPAQFPALGSPQVAGTRTKVALKPGHSLMDWIRLGRNNPDLAGTGGRMLTVSEEELAKHNTKDNAWMALRGRVYNVSPYMDFHPGGVDELMKGAGKDGTDLFDEIHKWVNFASMLEKCLVGKLEVKPGAGPGKAPTNSKKPLSSSKTNGLLNLPPPGPATISVSVPTFTEPLPVIPIRHPPRYEWYQSDRDVTVVIYTRCDNVQHEDVIVDRAGRRLTLTVHRLQAYSYTVHIELEHDVLNGYEVRALQPSGKVAVTMKKSTPSEKWVAIGQPLEHDKRYVLTADTDTEYRCCHLESISRVNHDTNVYCITLPEGTRMCVPTGYHIHLKANVEGMEVVRSYTVVRPSLEPTHQDARVSAGTALYLMIKIYEKGALTPQLQKLRPGDPLMVSTHTGDFQLSRLEACTHLVLYAAGTGLTPMINLIYLSATSKLQNQQIHVHLSFFNKTQEDILWRDQLEKLAVDCDRFEVRHILSQPDSKWTGLTGRVRKELMEEFIPRVGEGRKVLFCACGPTQFTEEVIRLVHELGYSSEMTHAFIG